MSIRRYGAIIVLLTAVSVFNALAQSQQKKDLTLWLTDAGNKLVQLAEAMPQEKYSWRPAPGVRSFSELCMHVVSANYYFPTMVGIKSDVTVSEEMEKKVTDKAKIVAMLKSSFEHMAKAINETPDAKFDTMVKMFGSDASTRSVFLLALSHSHEHLGQAIAYVRSNGVTPPWSKSE
jgi:uncharacterized damage-inducible protein DinB